MKSVHIGIILITLIIVFTLVFIVGIGRKQVVQLPVFDQTTKQYHQSNNYQKKSAIWIGEYNNQWFIVKEDALYQMGINGLKLLFRLQSADRPRLLHIIGQSERYLLYSIDNPTYPDELWDTETLYCYDLSENKNMMLTDYLKRCTVWNGSVGTNGMDYLDELGTAFIVMDNDSSPGFYKFADGNLEDKIYKQAGFQIGNTLYTVLSSRRDFENVYRIRSDGTKEKITLAPAERHTIIPASQGVVIHAEGYRDILWYIDNNENLTELFSFECLFSESCVAIHDDYIFCSLKRWEKYNDIFPQRFKDDEIEGTWRFSLKNFSKEKISEEIYTGMFIFDDSTICAVREDGRIVQMDFQGNIIQMILN